MAVLVLQQSLRLMVVFQVALSEMDGRSSIARLWGNRKFVPFLCTTILLTRYASVYDGLVQQHVTCIVYSKMKDDSNKIDLCLLSLDTDLMPFTIVWHTLRHVSRMPQTLSAASVVGPQMTLKCVGYMQSVIR